MEADFVVETLHQLNSSTSSSTNGATGSSRLGAADTRAVVSCSAVYPVLLRAAQLLLPLLLRAA
jgi:hypothetical protein